MSNLLRLGRERGGKGRRNNRDSFIMGEGGRKYGGNNIRLEGKKRRGNFLPVKPEGGKRSRAKGEWNAFLMILRGRKKKKKNNPSSSADGENPYEKGGQEATVYFIFGRKGA